MRNSLMVSLATAAIALAGCSDSGQGSASPSRAPAPTDLALPVAFGLPRDARGLAEEVRQISDPKSPKFQQWLTSSEIADRFGASSQDTQNVLSELTSKGFKGEADLARGYIAGQMTVGQIQDLIGVNIVQFPVSDGSRTMIGPATRTEQLTPPRGVTEVVGLTSSLPGSASTPSAAANPATPDFSSCVPLPNLEYLTSGQFGLTADYAGQGSGVHVAMLEVDQVDPTVLSYLAGCYGFTAPELTVVPAGPTRPDDFAGEVESDLDLALLAVGAQQLSKITVFQSNSVTSVFFPLAAAVAQSFAPNGPSIVTTSVGFCEKDVPVNDMELSEWALMTAAATGVSVIASTGDSGSSSCAPGDTGEEPQYPSSSPYVTGVGGTQFATDSDLAAAQSQALAVRTLGSQVVWNGGPQSSAGGGSTTSRLSRPWYQENDHQGRQRSVPDVAYLASPFALSPLLLCNSSGNCRSYGIGGTSAAAPAFAAAIARIASDTPASAERTERYGLLNPTVYQLAAEDPSVTLDVTTGDNDIYSAGCCTATEGYDSASGWGLFDVTDIDTFFNSRSSR